MIFLRSLLVSLALALGIAAISQAQWSPPAMLSAMPTPSGGASATQWNPSDKTASMTLSTTATTSDTALATNAGTYDGVRSETNTYSGKVYTEFKIVAQSGAFPEVGFCNSTASDVGSRLCGVDDNNGIALVLTNGPLKTNSGTNLHQFNLGNPITTGYTVAMAWDIANHIIWVRINNGSSWGNWDDNASDNPSTATGGLTLSSPPTGPFMLYFADFQGNNSDKVQMFCSGFLGSVPTGFSAC